MAEKRLFWNGRLTDYQVALLRYFRRRIGHLEDPEDLAQEVFLRLLRIDRAEHKPIKNPEAYLYTVAGNLLKERAVLRRRAGVNINIEEVAEDLVEPGMTPEEVFDQDIQERRLAEIVTNLPSRYRAVILMHYRHGMTYREIGERIGVSVHTVKKYVSHALVLCRRKFQQYN